MPVYRYLHLIRNETMNKHLPDFLQEWDAYNNVAHKKIPLFLPSALTKIQQQYFARLLYHARGHFSEFLWVLGSLASTPEDKKLILQNIGEEFGGSQPSHEMLYFRFAESLGVNLRLEPVREHYYEQFLQKYNKDHVSFLIDRATNGDWDTCMAAFSAYERLDNLDYPDLLRLVTTFDIPDPALEFFRVHCEVQHFAMVSTGLEALWNRQPDAVQHGYDFIANHQIKMW